MLSAYRRRFSFSALETKAIQIRRESHVIHINPLIIFRQPSNRTSAKNFCRVVDLSHSPFIFHLLPLPYSTLYYIVLSGEGSGTFQILFQCIPIEQLQKPL